MGFKVDYGAMRALLGACSSVIGEWSGAISSIMDKEAAIEASQNIAGNKADRMKGYLNAAYSCAGASITMLLETFQQNYLLYLDAYLQQVDPAGGTCIDEAELSDRHTALQEKRRQIQQIGLNAEKAIQGISDLVALPSLDVSEPDTAFSTILTSLDELDTAVNDLESAHVSADFSTIDALIGQLDAYFQELYGRSESFKTDFSMESFLALASLPALLMTTQDAYSQLEAQKSDVERASKNLERILQQEQAEWEKRKEQAEWAKVGFNIVIGMATTVASAALLATTGPVGVIIIGTVSGASSAVFSAAADEYVEKGWNTEDWDTDRIKIHGCIGAVTGMIGSLAPPGAGNCVKSGIKALGSAFEGVASTAYDQLEANGRITDVGEVAGNALLKGGATFAGSMVGNAVSDKVSGFVKQDSTIKDLAENVVGGKEHFSAVLKIEGASELVSGAAKRFSSTAVKETGGFVASMVAGKTIAEAYDEHSFLSESFKNAVDIKAVVEDAAGAVTSAATDNPLNDSLMKLNARTDDYYLFGDSPDLNGKGDAWNGWNSEEYDRMMQKLAEMDERGDDAHYYEIFGDPRTIDTQRQAAVKDAWEQERLLVLQGKGTRDWTVSQQEELIRTGKVSGFEGSHMLDVSSNPSEASNPDNIQFLTYEEHIIGAHDSNTRNPTTGWFDPDTGETTPINPGQIPHREQTSFELTDKFDYRQLDLADLLGPAFGYCRGIKSK